MLTPIDSTTGLAVGTFGIARLDDGRRRFAAIVRANGEIVDVSVPFPNIMAIYEDWPRSFDTLVNLEATSVALDRAFANHRACAPVERPQIFGAGSNFRQHVAEMYTYNKMNQHNRRPGESDEVFLQRNLKLVDERRLTGIPFFWVGTHGSMIGAEDNVVLPPIGTQHDWEAEVCCVVAGGAKRFMSPEEAGSVIVGYAVSNDFGTIDQFRRTDVNWGHDFISKHSPTFKAIGPFVVPKAFVKWSDDVKIQFRINGEMRQNWPVTDMIFSPEEILSYASERVRLLGGDLMLTGSPPGNGAKYGQFMQHGDIVETEVTSLGRQRNSVVAEDLGGRKPHFGAFRAD